MLRNTRVPNQNALLEKVLGMSVPLFLVSVNTYRKRRKDQYLRLYEIELIVNWLSKEGAIVLSWLFTTIYIWLYRNNYYDFAISVGMGIMLTAFLQLCEMINRLVKSSTKNRPNMQ